MKKLAFLFILLSTLIVSCSDSDDYMDAVPKKSPLVVSVDLMKYKGMDSNVFMRSLFHIHNMTTRGIDLAQKVYAFESPEGFYGLCCCVSDEDNLKELMGKNGFKLTDFRECTFSVLGNSWVVGYNAKSLLVMGPVTAGEQRNLMVKMASYLKQDADKGLRASDLVHQLDSIQEPMAMVAAMTSLPELMRSSLMLCAPKDMDANQLYYRAGISVSSNYVQVDGAIFAKNHKDDETIRDYQLRQMDVLHGKYASYIDEHNFVSILLNSKTTMTELTQGKTDFDKLFSALNVGSDINYRKIFDTSSGEMLVSVPVHSSQLHLLVSRLTADWHQFVPADMSEKPIGVAEDGTFFMGIPYKKVAQHGKWDAVVQGRRAAMLVNLAELQRVAPLPLLQSVHTALGNRQLMVLTVK